MPVNDEMSTEESIEDRVAAEPELDNKAEEIKPEDAEKIAGGFGHAIPPGPPS
jgi:hypothetical protein